MPRHFRRPLRPRGIFPPRVRPGVQRAMVRLRRAHQLLEAEDYPAAARIFSELADEADRRQMPRGAQLHLQAARTLLKAGEQEEALRRLHHGVDLLERTAQIPRLAALGPRIVAELRESGLVAEAASLQTKLDSLPTLGRLSQEKIASGTNKALPTKCGSCGGIVRSDEIEWLDSTHAICGYCGSVLESD